MPKHFAAARDVLDRAEKLAGGSEPHDEGRTEWLHTRLTRIECLVAMGHFEEAIRITSDTFDRPWIEQVPGASSDRQLSAKLHFIEIAVSIARQEYDITAALARNFRQNRGDGLMTGITTRATEIEQFAMRGDLLAISRTMVR